MSERERKAFNKFYQYWLTKHGVTDIRIFKQEFAKLDGCLTSGDTDVMFEYKDRPKLFQEHKYPTVFMEEIKYKALRAAASLLNSSSLYIVEYINAVFIWDIRSIKPVFYLQSLPSNNDANARFVDKSICELPMTTADFILAKPNNGYERRKPEDINYYLKHC